MKKVLLKFYNKSNLGDDLFVKINDIFKNAQDVCFREHASYELFKSLPHLRVATDIGAKR